MRNIVTDDEGVAGVEFAFLAPIFLLLFLGTVELSGFMTVYRRAEMANDSMAQVLSAAGSGAAGAMHNVWHIPSQMNPTSNYTWGWGDGTTWRNPFYFSQVVFAQTNPSCTKNCEKKSQRDFVFSFGKPKSCEVKTIGKGKKARDVAEFPAELMERQKPAVIVAHTAQYKPLISSRLLGFGSEAGIDIEKIAFAVRHDGQIWDYPDNGHGMYMKCAGPK